MNKQQFDMSLYLYNTLSRSKEFFTPIDAKNVRMYVCGPTVYDRPHLGNARSVVVYDVLFRLLNHLFGAEHVTYARNITDVDDKINTRAKELGIPIQQLTAEVTAQFHEDIGALNVLAPTHEPRATVHLPVMIALTQQLIENGHAYVKDGHVLFDTGSVPHYHPGADKSQYSYGMLSHRVQEDLVAGARVEVESYKKNPADFVLWKPAEEGDDPSSVFESPWGPGRPGWHIECSAMSSRYVGHAFDIHGGGADLMFPHHENEIAQSRCADKEAEFAKLWVHNGFLTVNGEKMSKSLGNFITVHDLLEKGVRGEVIRYAFLTARYSEPLDWNDKLLHDAKLTLDKFYRLLPSPAGAGTPPQAFIDALCDDLNTPRAFALLHSLPPQAAASALRFLGFLQSSPEEWFQGKADDGVAAQIEARIAAKKAKNYAEADRIRKALAEQGILLEDRPDGTTDWRRA